MRALFPRASSLLTPLCRCCAQTLAASAKQSLHFEELDVSQQFALRSAERRVGEECRSRGPPCR